MVTYGLSAALDVAGSRFSYRRSLQASDDTLTTTHVRERQYILASDDTLTQWFLFATISEFLSRWLCIEFSQSTPFYHQTALVTTML